MKLKLVVILCCAGNLSAGALFSQQSKLDVKFEGESIAAVFSDLQARTGYEFVYVKDIISENEKVTVEIDNASLEQVLDAVLLPCGLAYRITNGLVVITRSQQQPQAQQIAVRVTGRVTDISGEPLPGVAVVVQGTQRGTTTDAGGRYELSWPQAPNATLVFSFVGMATQEIAYSGQTEINVAMAELAESLDDVVVTGYFDRTRQSFTGSEVSVKGEELRQLGSMNLLTAISVFDPAVRTIENNEFGSDPNRVPEISIRGESGFDLRGLADDATTNPNAPLYILDGIEVSPTVVYDLDMNRIDSFTILKDASATALYGSRGANGVILITTIRPRSGELRVTTNANFYLSIPDLRDYNLMNAREKLEFERRAEVYVGRNEEEQIRLDMTYNDLQKEVARGVNTYWLSQPLQTSLNQRYSAFVEGGDQHIRYGVDLKYDTDKGVMKKGGRERYGVNVSLNYNASDKLRFYNNLSVDDVTGTDSPYGNFALYADMNPYLRIYDPETGEMNRTFTDYDDNIVKNPLYDGTLPNRSLKRYTEIKDNLTVEWRVTPHLQIKGLAALTKNIGKDEVYRSPESSEFYGVTDPKLKGRHTVSNSNTMEFEGNVRVMYNNVFAEKFTVSAGVGAEMSTLRLTSEGFSVTGFINDKLTNPAFALQLQQRSQTGRFDKERLAGFFANANIGYDNRFFFDATFRTDGSSKFGRNSRFAPFWSAGLAWNVDRESWWTGGGYMKIRASVGSMGTTNFDSDQAITRFSYTGESEYNGVQGAILGEYGNPNLKWQNTLQYNAGLDMSVWRDIIVLNLDVYLKRTQNLLMSIDVAPSSGFSSYRENLGSIDNSGVEARLRFNLIRDRDRDLLWSVALMAAHNKNVIRKLSTAMKSMNEEALKLENSQGGKVFRLYEEGRSQSVLAVVRSNGIDPMTGQEIYINRDGTMTFEYDPNQKVMVGDTNPTWQGNFQTNLAWKGFSLYAIFAYEYGAKAFNATLADKIEAADPAHNADRRVLYDRWYSPGDMAIYRDIRSQHTVYQSSRLVERTDFLRLSNLSLSYDIPRQKLSSTFIERCRVTLASSDLFRISKMKQERGTSYPFARSLSLGFSLTF